MGNCLCCAWVILGGMLATYLLQQAQPGPVEGVDGAVVGLLAGLVGAIVASLVEQHGGSLSVESEVGKGSVFAVELRPAKP
jgi:hypothetical protein